MSILHDTEVPFVSTTLDAVGELVHDLGRRQQWLAQQHSEERQQLLDRMLMLLGALADKAAWDVAVLLVELGCRKRTGAQLQTLTEDELTRCIGFFAWIGELGRQIPSSTTTMRALVSAASALYADAGTNLDACRRAMHQTLGPDDATTADDLLWLGEVGGAFSSAAQALPGRAGDAARAARAGNPFAVGHVPASTLERWLVASPSGSLPIEQRARLDVHVLECARCRTAATQRAEMIGLRERPLRALAEPLRLLLPS